MAENPEAARVRLGDCWVEGCLRDAFVQVTLTDPETGERATGLLCDVCAQEANDGP